MIAADSHEAHPALGFRDESSAGTHEPRRCAPFTLTVTRWIAETARGERFR